MTRALFLFFFITTPLLARNWGQQLQIHSQIESDLLLEMPLPSLGLKYHWIESLSDSQDTVESCSPSLGFGLDANISPFYSSLKFAVDLHILPFINVSFAYKNQVLFFSNLPNQNNTPQSDLGTPKSLSSNLYEYQEIDFLHSFSATYTLGKFLENNQYFLYLNHEISDAKSQLASRTYDFQRKLPILKHDQTLTWGTFFQYSIQNHSIWNKTGVLVTQFRNNYENILNQKGPANALFRKSILLGYTYHKKRSSYSPWIEFYKWGFRDFSWKNDIYLGFRHTLTF